MGTWRWEWTFQADTVDEAMAELEEHAKDLLTGLRNGIDFPGTARYGHFWELPPRYDED